ncbi:MAG: hypothetical protein RI887_414 [Actinomycetota bacterium]
MGVALEVFGHRGACGYLPENTMESFELAFELGCSAIEFDVVLTKDLVPVIRHDRDFSLTTDISATLKIGQFGSWIQSTTSPCNPLGGLKMRSFKFPKIPPRASPKATAHLVEVILRP